VQSENHGARRSQARSLYVALAAISGAWEKEG
jgi:hypothetical protein